MIKFNKNIIICDTNVETNNEQHSNVQNRQGRTNTEDTLST